ncbi:DUF3147 family protein [Thiobacillus sedimenti]|uniref:DUF3147 family protein n=1 Tax=Thiobacillus sedimenti TaxID=3110231 RepID=A0ABZ1CLT4_9PROT|nr:DUF3147 family protein [Thiobacillus sp. SCUT-2]WRS40159.1 DUF3147 family protein [Thiobacillus sp. SCUT-2]
MGQYALKVGLSALIIVAVAEIAKRSTFWAAALASLPLTSVLAFVWLYLDTGDVQKIAALSGSIFWLVLPSLVLLVVLPVLLRLGIGFWASLALSSAATALAYLGAVRLLAAFGIKL